MSKSMVNIWTASDKFRVDTKTVVRLLDRHEIHYQLIDISSLPAKQRGCIHSTLALDTGFVQLPNVYFGQDYHIGGIDDLKSYLQCPITMQRLIGQLQSELEEVHDDLILKDATSEHMFQDQEIKNVIQNDAKNMTSQV